VSAESLIPNLKVGVSHKRKQRLFRNYYLFAISLLKILKNNKNFMKLKLLIISILAANILSAQENLVKPEQTEFYEPVPKIVAPAPKMGDAPSDALILFDGKNFDNFIQDLDGSAVLWKMDSNRVLGRDYKADGPPVKWTLNGDGSMTVKGGVGGIKTKQLFGDCQLHVEWRSPMEPDSLKGQKKGNSGVFLQERYEVQVLNSYKNDTYTNGQAGSIYKQTPPMVNACRPMGEWNSYDIIYTAPRFRRNGSVEQPPKVTVIHNGIVVQNATIIQGSTEYIGAPKNLAHGKGAIKFQDHGNAVSYRNIWIREL
jgi:Domain of Unknown Function (DUF1080)